LGAFSVTRNSQEIPRAAWTRKRPVEIVTALALAQGHLLHREELIDRLWPDKDLDAGANNLYRALHELRRVAGDGLVDVERGVVRLGDGVWVDVDDFCKGASSSDAKVLEGALELYRGDLLPDDPYSDELSAQREALKQRFMDAGLRLARLEADPERRASVLRRVLAIDPTVEEVHARLMESLAVSGRKRQALKQYAECVRVLLQHFETSPSKELDELKRRIEADELTPAGPLARDAAPTAPSSSSPPKPPVADSPKPLVADSPKPLVADSPKPPVADSPKPPAPDSPEAQRASPGAVAPRAKTRFADVAGRLLEISALRPIHGRDAEVARAVEFGRTRQGVLLIVGEPGIGKTRFVVEAIRECCDRGDQVLVGVGYEMDNTAPYAPFVDAWSDHLRASGTALENPFLSFVPRPGASAQEDRLRLFQAVESSLVQLAGDGSVTLVLDDLQQADESSLFLVYHLARACRQLPLKLICTARDEDVRVDNPLHSLLAGLGRERLATRIELPRLDKEGTAELVATLCKTAPTDAVVDQVFRLCGGNPFFVEEVVASLSTRESPAGLDISSDVARMVRARVSALGPEGERLLTTAAVEGTRFHFDVAAKASGVSTPTALDALDHAIEARIVEEHEERYRFRHAITREALYRSLSAARRAHLHQAVADALEALDARQIEALAHHRYHAGQSELALPHCLKAAEGARARLGFGEAVSFSERALELVRRTGQGAGPQEHALLRSMGEMRIALGDLDQAVEDLTRACTIETASWRPSARERAGALRLTGLALVEAGQLAKAEVALTSALDTLQGQEAGSELCNVYYLFAQLRWHQERHAEAYELAEKCLREAERLDDSEAIAKGYEMLALACHSLGDWKKGTDFEQRRSQLAEGGIDVASAFDVHL